MRLATPTVPSGSEAQARRAAQLPAVLLLLAAAGCTSVGPSTVPRDRFDYSQAITESWKRQTLLNLLKVRYADAPVFMDVSSVISAEMSAAWFTTSPRSSHAEFALVNGKSGAATTNPAAASCASMSS